MTKVIASLSAFCAKDINVVNLTQQIHEQAQRALLASSPNIVVSTPSRATQHLNSSTLIVDGLKHLVIDEADLVMSYGHGEDLQNLVKLLPNGVQTFLASATLATEVNTLKGLFCRDPIVLDLQEEEKESKKSISQYVVKCAEDEKFLLIFALFKLKLVKGKCIVFVGDVDRCYRLKLYLEQFGIKSCVLNSELPVNCRIHVVEEFNKNVYDIIIATDENEIVGEEKQRKSKKQKKALRGAGEQEDTEPADNNDTAAASAEPTEPPTKDSKPLASKKKRATKGDHTYGISRGIDFQHVSCVLNFDLPLTSSSYTHRIGRAARAGRTGIALSFAIPAAEFRKHKPTTFAGCAADDAVLASIVADQATHNAAVEPFQFDMAKLDGFRYRVASALKAVSPGSVREARIRELRQEMLRSEKLKRHLEENPEDLKWLRHDTEVRAVRVQSHLKHVPDYLMPAGAGDGAAVSGGGAPVGGELGGGFVAMGKMGDNRIRNARAKNRLKGKGRIAKSKNADPLKTFNAKGRR